MTVGRITPKIRSFFYDENLYKNLTPQFDKYTTFLENGATFDSLSTVRVWCQNIFLINERKTNKQTKKKEREKKFKNSHVFYQ